MRSIFILILLTTLVSLSPAPEQPDEIIRRKLENITVRDVYALGAPLYCAVKLNEFYLNRSFETA